MRANRFTLSAIALLAGIGVAAAQQQIPANQATNPIGDGPFKSQQGGKEEPSSHASGANKDAVFVDGKLNVPGAPPDSQTVPSKFSERNAEPRPGAIDPGSEARTNAHMPLAEAAPNALGEGVRRRPR